MIAAQVYIFYSDSIDKCFIPGMLNIYGCCRSDTKLKFDAQDFIFQQKAVTATLLSNETFPPAVRVVEDMRQQ